MRGTLRRIPAAKGECSSHLTGVRSDTQIARVLDNAIDSRLRRDKFLPAELFGEPAWDMLLRLYAAHLAQRPTPIGGLCSLSAVPPTTTLRWLQKLLDLNLVQRTDDSFNRTFVQLTRTGLEAMDGYFLAERQAGSSTNTAPSV